MQLPGLFPDYFAVGLRKTEGWLTFGGLWLSVISNAKPDLRDIRDPEKKRAAQGRTAQVTEGTPKAKVQRRGNARGPLDRTSLRPECDFTGEITLAFTGIAPTPQMPRLRAGAVAKFWRLRLVEPAGGLCASEPEVPHDPERDCREAEAPVQG